MLQSYPYFQQNKSFFVISLKLTFSKPQYFSGGVERKFGNRHNWFGKRFGKKNKKFGKKDGNKGLDNRYYKTRPTYNSR